MITHFTVYFVMRKNAKKSFFPIRKNDFIYKNGMVERIAASFTISYTLVTDKTHRQVNSKYAGGGLSDTLVTTSQSPF